MDGVEIAATAAELVAHRDWQSGFRPVWDLTGVTKLDMSPAHLKAMLSQEARFEESGDGGDSVVITRDEVTKGLMLILEAHARRANRTLTTVSTVEEAETVLGFALPC